MNNETYVTIGWWLIGVLSACISYLAFRFYMERRRERLQFQAQLRKHERSLHTTEARRIQQDTDELFAKIRETRQLSNNGIIYEQYNRNLKSADEWRQTIQKFFGKIREQSRLDPIVIQKVPFEQLKLPLDWDVFFDGHMIYKVNRCHHEFRLSKVLPQSDDYYRFFCPICLVDFPILKTDFWGPSRFERELKANIERFYGKDAWYWSHMSMTPPDSFVTIKDDKIVPLDLNSL